MQNNAIMRGEFRMYPKAVEKELISSRDYKQGLVEATLLPKSCEILPVSTRLSCESNASDETRIRL